MSVLRSMSAEIRGLTRGKEWEVFILQPDGRIKVLAHGVSNGGVMLAKFYHDDNSFGLRARWPGGTWEVFGEGPPIPEAV